MPASSQIVQRRKGDTSVGEMEPAMAARFAEPDQSPKGNAQEQARRGSWKGLSRIALFFSLIVGLIFGVNSIVNAGLRRIKTSEFGVSNRIVNGEINADIIISGSSRAVSHYDPRIIEPVVGHSVFNLGRNGSQTDMQLAVLKTYLRHNTKPKLVIHNLDAFSFVTTREVYDPAQYMPYLSEPDLYAALQKIDGSVWWKSKYLPLYGYAAEDMRFTWITGLHGIFGWSPREDSFLGFTPRTGQWTEDFEKYKEANPDGVNFAVEPAGVRIMEELARLCHDSDIRLVFVYSPEFRQMQSLTKNRAEIFDQFRKVAAPYNVPIWDFSDWKYSSDQEYFRNSQHLNAVGAELFSKDFAEKLAQESPSLGVKASGNQRDANVPN